METRKAKTKVVAAVLALAALCVFSLFAVGGNLEPNAPPGPTMHTLDEIYNEVTSAGSEDGDSIPHHSEVEGSGAILYGCISPSVSSSLSIRQVPCSIRRWSQGSG